MATITARQLADGQLANSIGTLYTATSVIAYVKSIVYVNTGAGTNLVNLYVKPSGGTARRIIAKNTSLLTNEAMEFDVPIVLDSGDLISGDATSATEVDFTIYGATEA